MGMIKEFKEFAVKGNVVDMAVGIIIGAAFGKIITSLVNDILMPPLGALMGGADFSDKVITLKQAVMDAAGAVATPAVVISYGKFVNTVIDFGIVAFAIFLLVKGINTLKRKEVAHPSAPPPPSGEEKLLVEIRDLLKTR